MVHRDVNIEMPSITLMFMQWGQFIDHDMVGSAQSRGFNGSIPQCCQRGGGGFLPPELLVNNTPHSLHAPNKRCFTLAPIVSTDHSSRRRHISRSIRYPLHRVYKKRSNHTNRLQSRLAGTNQSSHLFH